MYDTRHLIGFAYAANDRLDALYEKDPELTFLPAVELILANPPVFDIGTTDPHDDGWHRITDFQVPARDRRLFIALLREIGSGTDHYSDDSLLEAALARLVTE